MSYDVDIRVKVEGVDYYIPVGVYSEIEPNITWNVSDLILASSGWKIKSQ